MRNRLVHEYDDVNLNIVWDVVQSEIPSLIEESSTSGKTGGLKEGPLKGD